MQKNNNGQTPKAFLTLKLDSMQTFELINALRCNNIRYHMAVKTDWRKSKRIKTTKTMLPCRNLPSTACTAALIQLRAFSSKFMQSIPGWIRRQNKMKNDLCYIIIPKSTAARLQKVSLMTSSSQALLSR